ncbi:DUF72 domain-containing protein [Aquabacterium sp.]|uniref:DUF72 domain-containing protein n=1 Tax=Aquabacterium sp. TaxID=1872578 RepID=UPI002D1C82F6|nr:DUF72 domain-containing protein [Aquabacterium sp.]HSW07546.1 DUF72 domain-containing protein [Aquabacterium sp.]
MTHDDLLGEAASPQPVGRSGNVRVGLCSWSDPSLIKSKAFYPRGAGTPEGRLRFYAQNFPVVEVDSSFYALPDPANSVRWVARTPANFRFNLKAFRLLTGHQTPPQVFPPDIAAALPPLKARQRNHYYADLPDEIVDEVWRRFITAIAPLKDAGKLLAVHFQFAPWVSHTARWRAHVEACVQRMAGHLVAIEFRNASWFSDGRVDDTLAWLRELRVVHTIVDEPQGVGNYAQGIWEVTHPELAVVRLHGRNAETWDAKGLSASSDRFNYEYGDAELDELSRGIDALADRVFDVVVLLNVNYEDQGVRAAQALQRRQRRLMDRPLTGG